MPRLSGRRLLEIVRIEIDFIARMESSGALDAYPRDPVGRRAIERSLEIAGEAIRQIEDDRPDLASRISEVRKIVEFRNKLAHDISYVDARVIRRIIDVKLPVLSREVASLLLLEML